MAAVIYGYDKEAEQKRLQLMEARHRFELLQGWVLVAGVGVLVFCQAMLYFDHSRITETWYGEDYTAEQVEVNAAFAASNKLWGSVTLVLVEHSRLDAAKVLINNQEVGSFKESELTLRVFDGDDLAIDCRAYAQPVRLQVAKTSYGIDRSHLLTDALICGNIISLGKIVFE